MVHLRLIPYLLLIISIIWLNSVLGKKVSTLSPSQVPVIELNRPEIVPISQMAQYQEVSNPTIRASSFMVDPLIIIALIALPTIGMLGVSSLIMPLIPIGIYLIQQFFPASTGRRRRRRRSAIFSNIGSFNDFNQWEHRMESFLGQFNRMLEQFIHHQ
ncbi:hypothetical protein BLOT_015270 [Blomia tropicalis]|nr:hypothetical protein BLOT_015270 [Blomia tropicalis]